KGLVRAASSRKPLSILQSMLSPVELQVGRRAPRVRQPSNHGVSGFDFPNRHRGKSRKSVGKETHNGERDERRDIPSSHRKAPGADHETGVLLYTPAIWQSADTPESAFRATAARVRAVLCQGRHAG